MAIFSKTFKVNTTRVHLVGEIDPNKMRKVTFIDDSRKWIKVDGLHGPFVREAVLRFTNKTT